MTPLEIGQGEHETTPEERRTLSGFHGLMDALGRVDAAFNSGRPHDTGDLSAWHRDMLAWGKCRSDSSYRIPPFVGQPESGLHPLIPFETGGNRFSRCAASPEEDEAYTQWGMRVADALHASFSPENIRFIGKTVASLHSEAHDIYLRLRVQYGGEGVLLLGGEIPEPLSPKDIETEREELIASIAPRAQWWLSPEAMEIGIDDGSEGVMNKAGQQDGETNLNDEHDDSTAKPAPAPLRYPWLPKTEKQHRTPDPTDKGKPRELIPKPATSYAMAGEPVADHEAALAGICLSPDNAAALDAIAASGVTAEDFTGPAGRVVLAALDLYAAGNPVDLYTVPDRLAAATLAALGGEFALSRLVDTAPPMAHAAFHCRALIDAGTRHRLAARATGWKQAAENGTPPADLMETIRAAIEAEERRMNGRAGDLFGVSLSALAESEIDMQSVLLGVDGVRYLCRGGTMLFVGPSGVGKSTASAQQDILWALGRPAFGISPARPLRIVTVQAENDRGDLIHMARGIMAALDLNAEHRAIVEANTRYISHNASTGTDFLAFLERVLREHRPDLLRIDPLMAYAGGDLTKAEVIASFCRNGLNRLATKHGCGIVACHHTPKQNSTGANAQARKAYGAFDWQYQAAGSADLANWARAMLMIDPLSRELFAFRAAKRWPGWKEGKHDDNWEAVYVRHFRQEREHGKVFWHDATPEDVATAVAKSDSGKSTGPDLESLEGSALALVTEYMEPSVFKDLLNTKFGLAKNKCETLLKRLIRKGALVRWTTRTWPCEHYIGTPQQHKAWQRPPLSSQSSQIG